MQWNCVYRKNEVFPHPNYYVEMGKTDEPLFLETFPQVKIVLYEWATTNIDKSSCESIGNELHQKIIPETYNFYLKECHNNQQLSMDGFLKSFHLKSVPESTIWRWMNIIGFKYCDCTKKYFCDKHESNGNVRYHENFINNI